jgi:hypothetical protein
VLVAEDEAAALQEDRGDLFFTTSVENRESPLYIGHYPGTRTGAPIREPRGSVLPASVAFLMGRCFRNLTGNGRALSLTCFELLLLNVLQSRTQTYEGGVSL